MTRTIDSAEEAAALLRDGRLVAIPTETVYGLGGVAWDEAVLARIFAAKERPHFDPLILHLHSPGALPSVAVRIPEIARTLADRFWPGPLTLVLEKQPRVPLLATSGLNTVAVRVPDHPLTHDVLRLVSAPVAAPSANRFGRLSPTLPAHVLSQLEGRIDAVLDGGPCRVGVESTIIDCTGARPRLLRPGGTPLEQIEAVVGPVEHVPEGEDGSLAPGRLPHHYAPSTPLRMFSTWPADIPEETGLLALSRDALPALARDAAKSRRLSIELLSDRSDVTEAAARFFPALHRLDASGCTEIWAIEFPEAGLGRALNDRLRRAAAR